MERYLACILGSDSYLDAGFACFNTKEEARQYIVTELLRYEYDNSEIRYISDNRIDADDGDRFDVGEIYKVYGDGDYVLVTWHAFAGVDFSIDSNAINLDAAKFELEEYKKYMENEMELEVEDGYSKYSIFADTGEEWMMAQIVDLRR